MVESMRGVEEAAEEEVVVWGAETGQWCQTPDLNRDVIYCVVLYYFTLNTKLKLKDFFSCLERRHIPCVLQRQCLQHVVHH